MHAAIGRVPVRVDLAGGTLDIWPIHLTLPVPAVTVNVALDLPAIARVTPLAGARVALEARDRGERAEHASPSALSAALARGDAPAALLGRAVLAAAPEGGLSLVTEAASPAGAGLGGSSALLACAVATLSAAAGRPRPLEEVRRLAQDVETAVVGGPTGYQDYYPPLFGGCLALEGRPGGVVVERLPVDLEALGRRLRLVYTGVPHRSGMTNWGAMRAYFDGEPATVGALREIADLAIAVRAALRGGDLDAALAAVVAEGAVRRRMAPGVSTPATERVDAAARRAGAVGTKPCGAGGGGCVLVVLRDEQEPDGLAGDLLAAGARTLPCRLVTTGYEVTTPEGDR